jgi:hypothetical protein
MNRFAYSGEYVSNMPSKGQRWRMREHSRHLDNDNLLIFRASKIVEVYKEEKDSYCVLTPCYCDGLAEEQWWTIHVMDLIRNFEMADSGAPYE